MINKKCKIDYFKNIYQLDDSFNKKSSSLFETKTFLKIFADSNCIGGNSGWNPIFSVIHEESKQVGFIPMFEKYNSYGEYVFDWEWANFYNRYQVEYYPKLVIALPFTPIVTNKFVIKKDIKINEWINDIVNFATKKNYSSVHFLHLNKNHLDFFSNEEFFFRNTFTFDWLNKGFENFDEYLLKLSSKNRKKIKQERRKIADQNIITYKKTGSEITLDDLQLFYNCYLKTYHNHYSSPYLNFDFFMKLYDSFKDKIVLFISELNKEKIASSFFLLDDDKLFGRYWGSLDFFPNLHFELCFYQPIEYCIENNISYFNAGIQGAHKILKGMSPNFSYSAHYIVDKDFREPIRLFCEKETESNIISMENLSKHDRNKLIS